LPKSQLCGHMTWENIWGEKKGEDYQLWHRSSVCHTSKKLVLILLIHFSVGKAFSFTTAMNMQVTLSDRVLTRIALHTGLFIFEQKVESWMVVQPCTYESFHVAMTTATEKCSNLFPCIKYKKLSCKWNQLGAQFFLVYVCLSVSTYFGWPWAHHHNCVYATLFTCYSVWMTVRYVGWPPHVPDSRLIDINIVKKIVHQVGFICKIIERCMVNKT